MPTRLHESNIDWEFPDGWTVTKYDDWTWYRKHFNNCAESAATDFLVLADDDSMCWLLEAKDFTTEEPEREKGPLHDIVTHKIRDTLAGLVAAAVNCDGDEGALARRFLKVKAIRVAFHCERPTNPSKLFKGLPSAADVQQKLRTSLRAVDTKAIVLDTAMMPSPKVPWSATWNPKKK